MAPIYFVTRNNYKFKKICDASQSSQFEFIQLSEVTPEIQAENNSQIAEFSAKWAAKTFNKSVVCEDVGLYIDYFGGFPGPYLSQVEKWIGSDGFLKLMEDIDNRSARWEYSVAFCNPNKEPISFSTFSTGSIAKFAAGIDGWPADKVFIPDSETKTIAQLLDENLYQRNKDHYERLFEHIEKTIEK